MFWSDLAEPAAHELARHARYLIQSSEPRIEKYARSTRAMIIAGMSVGSWLLVGTLTGLLVR